MNFATNKACCDICPVVNIKVKSAVKVEVKFYGSVIPHIKDRLRTYALFKNIF